MDQTVPYYLYTAGGLYAGRVDLPLTAKAPANSTLTAPLGAGPGQTYRRVGSEWIVEVANG